MISHKCYVKDNNREALTLYDPYLSSDNLRTDSFGIGDFNTHSSCSLSQDFYEQRVPSSLRIFSNSRFPSKEELWTQAKDSLRCKGIFIDNIFYPHYLDNHMKEQIERKVIELFLNALRKQFSLWGISSHKLDRLISKALKRYSEQVFDYLGISTDKRVFYRQLFSEPITVFIYADHSWGVSSVLDEMKISDWLRDNIFQPSLYVDKSTTPCWFSVAEEGSVQLFSEQEYIPERHFQKKFLSYLRILLARKLPKKVRPEAVISTGRDLHFLESVYSVMYFRTSLEAVVA